jgi:hypothetical protein
MIILKMKVEKIMNVTKIMVSTITLVSILFLNACVSDVANRYYLDESYQAKNVSEVEVLKSKPDRPFVVMADFQSRGESTEDLRRKAAEIGADAVIIVTVGGNYSLSEEWAHEDRYKDKTHSHILGTAIKFTKE